ncbi:MAG: D-ribose pyranase [Paracoccus hibiscisoli]|uniref:D-ribose pyranase n=1 Tax=Paracoccus hibiscisoli TaxID=2023261 RepID=UPI003918F9DD
MKRTTLLHAELSGLIASFGHGDLLVIGDAGLPVPPGVRVIDLALTRGIPGIFDVLDTVLSELVVERASLAEEAAPDLCARFAERAIGAVTLMSHAAFKDQSRQARAVVRTGECRPYANIALYAGVAF